MSASPLLKQQDLQFLIDLADDAGKAIMQVYNRREQLVNTKKADASPLTEADLASNVLLLRGLTERWPEIPVLSEECVNTFTEGDRPEFYWAVDPLDGTKEFIKGNGEFTVNIALVVNGFPKVGVVGAPALGLMYVGVCVGVSGLLASAKKRDAHGWADIKVSGYQPYTLNNSPIRVAMSRSHPSAELTSWLVKFPQADGRDIGSSLKFCLVAEGVVDVYPRLGPTCIWDTAAGHGLVSAAGGHVVQWDGAAMSYALPAKTLNPHFIAWGHSS